MNNTALALPLAVALVAAAGCGAAVDASTSSTAEAALTVAPTLPSFHPGTSVVLPDPSDGPDDPGVVDPASVDLGGPDHVGTGTCRVRCESNALTSCALDCTAVVSDVDAPTVDGSGNADPRGGSTTTTGSGVSGAGSPGAGGGGPCGTPH